MHKLSLEAIENLAAYEGDSVLTIYIPTHSTPTPPNISENQTRYKNMIRKGFEVWRSHEGDDAVPSAIERRMEERLDDLAFWQQSSRCLALFIGRENTLLYHLPIEVNEQVYVGPVYDIVPLLQFQSQNQPYYVFALALHEPKLYRGDMYGLEPVAIDFPASPEAALNIDEMYINSNTVRAGSGSMQGSPHGQGDSQQAGQEERLMYFRILDQLLLKSPHVNSRVPLIIAAADSETGDYCALTKYPNVLKRHISGNRTKEDANALHELAQEIIAEEVVAEQMKECAEQYDRLVGAKKATDNLSDIRRAAREGRVDKLLLSIFDRRRDSVSDDLSDIVYTEVQTPEQRQGLLTMIRDVLTNGGNIEMFNRNLMPAHARVAALYRY